MQQCLVKKNKILLVLRWRRCRNLGPANANSVTVSATFYDLDDKVVDTDYAFTKVETIPPGKKASFEISILSDKKYKKCRIKYSKQRIHTFRYSGFMIGSNHHGAASKRSQGS